MGPSGAAHRVGGSHWAERDTQLDPAIPHISHHSGLSTQYITTTNCYEQILPTWLTLIDQSFTPYTLPDTPGIYVASRAQNSDGKTRKPLHQGITWLIQINKILSVRLVWFWKWNLAWFLLLLECICRASAGCSLLRSLNRFVSFICFWKCNKTSSKGFIFLTVTFLYMMDGISLL